MRYGRAFKVRIDEDAYERLERIAEHRKTTLSEVVRQVLYSYLEKLEQERQERENRNRLL